LFHHSLLAQSHRLIDIRRLKQTLYELYTHLEPVQKV